MNDVKSVMAEITLPLVKQMKVREDEAVRATNHFNQIFKDVKELQVATRQANMLKN